MSVPELLLTILLGTWLAFLYSAGGWLILRLAGRFQPTRALMLSSLIGRAGGALFCFAFVAQDGRWDRLIACAAGFFLFKEGLRWQK